MCMSNMGRILDPAKLLTGNSAKWADPLGVTKTAIGDPTGQLRRNADNEAKAKDIANGGPEQRAQAAYKAQQMAAMQKYQQPGARTILGG